MKQKFYGIYNDTRKEITTSWDEAKVLIHEMPKANYKAFSTYEDAYQYIHQIEASVPTNEPMAYIDGSYDVKTKRYSFGGVLILGSDIYQFKKAYPENEFSPMRNVAGEIKGAGYILQYAINHNIKKIHIYYDYVGIEKWYTKSWQAKSLIAIEYVKFCDKIRSQIEVVFHKVKSHTNNKYNDMADQLAKDALGL